MITDYLDALENMSVVTRPRVRALRIALGILWVALVDPVVFVDGYEEGEKLYKKEHEPCNRTNTR